MATIILRTNENAKKRNKWSQSNISEFFRVADFESIIKLSKIEIADPTWRKSASKPLKMQGNVINGL